MLTAILTLAGLALAFGLLLGYSSIRFKVEGDPIADRVDALLPQTQCGQCGFPGCRPYAEAIAAGEAEINRCPPGGSDTMFALAELLGRDPMPMDGGTTEEKPAQVAFIDESLCIGCTLCVQACPVDAILGAAKQMHTIISTECTGCELCVAPCPVACIQMVPMPQGLSDWRWPYPDNSHHLDSKGEAA
jgi:electron transport complex protein RnfB